jgi:hypothetical protein
MPPMPPFEGRRALVTGESRGFGGEQWRFTSDDRPRPGATRRHTAPDRANVRRLLRHPMTLCTNRGHVQVFAPDADTGARLLVPAERVSVHRDSFNSH